VKKQKIEISLVINSKRKCIELAYKTNVMRILDSLKIDYESFCYENSGAISGVDVAKVLNEDERFVFKTLVTRSNQNVNYVFVIPVNEELDLKKCAKFVNEKSIEMIKQKELLPLTGYIHGGCSPIGMKKKFITVLHNTAQNMEAIYISGGKVGYQIKIKVKDLERVISIKYCDLVKQGYKLER